MKVDLSCPIEMRGYALSYSTDAVHAVVRLHNLDSRRISSFEAIAKWRSSASERSIAAPFSAERLRAGGENGFKISLSNARLPDADRLDVLFTRVRFEDGSADWLAGAGTIVDIAPIKPISSEELGMLRAVAGEDAVCYPRQDTQAWRCVCGRANPNSEDSCARCQRNHFTAIGYTAENVRFHYEAAQPVQEESVDEALIEELHSRYLRQRSKLLRRTIAMAVAVLALTTLLVMKYQPDSIPQPPAETMTIDN